MRAVMYEHFGDASVLTLREHPIPLPARGEVQVRVTQASLNPVDFKLRSGILRLIGRPQLPAITGKDFAGVIASLIQEIVDLTQVAAAQLRIEKGQAHGKLCLRVAP